MPRELAVVRRWIGDLRPDLVVHLGDISVDGASNPAELREAAAAFADLNVPIRFLPGNHDVGENPIAPDVRAEHPLDLAQLEEYRVLFGPDYWSLCTGAWQLIGVNAQLFGTGTSEAHIPYVPAAPRRRLLAILRCRALRFVLSGHTHQSRQLICGGVEHRWAPSTAFCLPDGMQERIGEKEVGILALLLDGTTHRFAVVRPEGLRRHNILHHPQLYPGIAALRARLGAAGVF